MSEFGSPLYPGMIAHLVITSHTKVLGLMWFDMGLDFLIVLAYLLISLVLLRLLRRRPDIPHRILVCSFCGFLVACSLARVLDLVALWTAAARFSGSMKMVFTAALSVTGLLILARLAPAIEGLPSAMHLDQVNRQLSSMIESMTACVIACDRHWKIIYLNENARQRVSAHGSVVGRTMFEAFPLQKPETVDTLRQVMETRKAEQFESFYEPLNLSTLVSASPWINGGVTIFFTDISEQKKLQRELDEERAMRERRIEALAHMAGGLAHEISNPLGIIHARASDLVEMMREDHTPDPAAVAGACTSIVKTSDRAIRILSGLRMFARDGRSDPLETAEVSIIVEQAVDLVEQRYAAHGIAIMVDRPEKALWINCREVQIGQILLNLLNSAFDALSGQSEERRWVRILVAGTASRVTVDVIDGGDSVPSEHQTQKIMPFATSRLSNASVSVGLSLSQAIAHDHGGSLLLTGDQPTCFRLTLPRVALAAGKVAA